MKTTLELPDQLVEEIKLRASHEGQELSVAVVDLLRKGLAVRSPTLVQADEAMLARRRALTQKFVSGEMGVELAGFEEAQEVDRQKSLERAQAWRD